ncbi:hypothetical protein Y032_0004g1877 [Ancylostoma ceylanicum]|uniref:Uncharacterized protein n=1 Tax=Ancylostoma ceylanicum TaxID=53326 RepID=A0A016VUH2_9BILA|nr:hypothetical protein Y032_0004g1877 [Ancylostoma ceylanicum]
MLNAKVDPPSMSSDFSHPAIVHDHHATSSCLRFYARPLLNWAYNHTSKLNAKKTRNQVMLVLWCRATGRGQAAQKADVGDSDALFDDFVASLSRRRTPR